MRTTLLSFCFLSLLSPLMAHSGHVAERIQAHRSRGTRFEQVSVLERVASDRALQQRWEGDLAKATVVRLRPGITRELQQRAAPFLSFEVPTNGTSLVLDLERTAIGTDDLLVRTSSGGVSTAEGVHYRGMVRGVSGSWAAISIFDGEVMGLFHDGQDEVVLGRFSDRADDLHVVYREADLRSRAPFTCATRDAGDPYRPDQIELSGGERTVRCVRYYWEVNYNVFQDKGSVANTTNYVTGLFNQSATLFDNDGIDVLLSEVFVWDTPSPYTQTSSGDLLDQFGVTRTSFNGDMAHLLGYGGGGGVAWLNTLCNGQTRLRMAYSGINSTYSNVPTYSWSTMVVTHEAGHNLGSQHTHACAWNGNGTNIDGCGPTANSAYSEGNCPIGPIPSSAVGGTIMSYCHLLSAGINLNNGFGPQPTAVIVNAVNNASCLTICGSTCNAPGTLTVGNLTTTSAQLGWVLVGANSYDLRWRQVGGPTWTNVNGLTTSPYTLNGLTQGVNYEFQVRSVCASSTSAYSNSQTFTTPIPCPDVMEPNNSVATAATITVPANISALIATNTDVDYYKFTTTTTTNIFLSLSNLAGDYDLILRNAAGTQLAASENGGNASESISYTNAAAGTYVVQVLGWNGAFSAVQCYSLNASVVSTGCQMPDGVSASAITYTTATLNWPAVAGAASYDLRWRVQGGPTWTDVTGIATNSHALSLLTENTAYEMQVRTNCSGVQGGSGSSEYTQGTFTTLSCDGSPSLRVAVKVMLDGPYSTANQLMADGLRTSGLVPLQEPYTALGHVLRGARTTTAPVLAVTGNNAIVDWVVVELRSNTSPFAVLEAKAGLLQRDGDVVAVDGTSALGFCTAAGTYRVSVRHRNHLGVMTNTGVALNTTAATVNFMLSGTATYGTNARRTQGSVMTLWAGNTTGNTDIKYTGASNDRDPILVAVGGTVPTNTVSGYRSEDINLDGVVKYTGANNDRDPILVTVGGTVPTNVVLQQLP